jgi:hypothetical protein
MPKKTKKLNSLTQAHAKVDSFELTSLDQIWGFNEISRYGTVDESEYSLKLKEMTRSDLENHARGVGCMVVESSDRLKDMLLKQFRAYVLSLKKPAPQQTAQIQVTPEIRKILNEGR